MTCVHPSVAVRALPGSRRSAVWIALASRIQSGAGRWSETRISCSGSRISRMTTAEPIVPAPPVTSTRLIRFAPWKALPRGVDLAGLAEHLRGLDRVGEDLRGAQRVPGVDEQAVGRRSRSDLA